MDSAYSPPLQQGQYLIHSGKTPKLKLTRKAHNILQLLTIIITPTPRLLHHLRHRRLLLLEDLQRRIVHHVDHGFEILHGRDGDEGDDGALEGFGAEFLEDVQEGGY